MYCTLFQCNNNSFFVIYDLLITFKNLYHIRSLRNQKFSRGRMSPDPPSSFVASLLTVLPPPTPQTFDLGYATGYKQLQILGEILGGAIGCKPMTNIARGWGSDSLEMKNLQFLREGDGTGDGNRDN
jgi:hypothetical protein